MSAVNFVDGGALESLETLSQELGEVGVTLHLAEVKGPVMDRFERIGFQPSVFRSTHDAVSALAPQRGEVQPERRSEDAQRADGEDGTHPVA